jgi:hypothetical protein
MSSRAARHSAGETTFGTSIAIASSGVGCGEYKVGEPYHRVGKPN